MSRLTGRDPGAGGAKTKTMPKAKGNAIPPRALKGGGLDNTKGDAPAPELTRLSAQERPPHSAMNATRNMEDVNQPGSRRTSAEQGPPLAAGRSAGRGLKRGRRRSR